MGEWIFEGLPMGHFQKFKVLWKLDLKIELKFLSNIHLDLKKVTKSGLKVGDVLLQFPVFFIVNFNL